MFLHNALRLWNATSTVTTAKIPSMALPIKNLSAPDRPQIPSLLSSASLLNVDLIRSTLLAEAPWAESHGADHNVFLGAGMLYYSWAYAFQARTIVVLGSGGGFVPRILRQAQRDLERAFPSWSDQNNFYKKQVPSKLYLIDAHLPQAGWGSTFYANNPLSLMHREFADIEYMFELTDDAFAILQSRNVSIDYLHIDADHSLEQSWKDFTNFVTLLSDQGAVSFHDTCYSSDNCRTGVHGTLERLQHRSKDYNLQLVDAHYLYNGIAFAIRQTAPSIRMPRHWKEHFCRNNANRLQLSGSAGFTHDGLGSLSTLGDFVNCSHLHQENNSKKRKEPCPFGTFPQHRGQAHCNLCIPGMTGANCSSFQYEGIRSQLSNQVARVHDEEWRTPNKASAGSPDETPLLPAWRRLVVAWLKERHTERLLEWGLIGPDRQSLLHSTALQYQLFVLVDPLVDRPMWLDDVVTTHQTRLLPCQLQDIIRDKKTKTDPDGTTTNATGLKDMKRLYQSLLFLKYMDAFVCIDCDKRVSDSRMLEGLLVKVFTNVTTIVLDGSTDYNSTKALDQIKTRLTNKMSDKRLGPRTVASWQVDSDVILGNIDSSSPSASRRLILLYKEATPTVMANWQ